MLLTREAICKKVEKLELEKSKEIKYDHPFISTLEVFLLDVYGLLRPQPSAYEQRQVLVQMFNEMAKEIFGSENGFPVVEAFGSFIMDLFIERSDLDLSLNFNDDYTIELPRDKKIAYLRKFSKHLYAKQARRSVSGVKPVLGARVPVLKVVDVSTGIECDISVENKDGISRTLILKIISSIDERFRILSYLMKVWAKAHGINSSKDRTMNSLTIISLVAIHLQTRDPPILPPFSALLKDGTDTSCVQNAVLGFRNFGNKNKESISELFVALFCKLSSVQSLWPHGLCASTYDGCWISKKWKSGIANMSVEDFLDRGQNFARAVAKAEMQKINKCIQGTHNDLLRFMKGQIGVPKLKNLLFRSISLKMPSDKSVPSEGIDHKRKAPLHCPSAAPPEPIKKKLRNSEASWSKESSLPAPTIIRSSFAEKLGNTEAAWSTDSSLPAPTILYPSFAPPQPSNQLLVGSLSVPSQSGYELRLQRHPVASHRRPQHQLGPIPSQHPQHSFAPKHLEQPLPSFASKRIEHPPSHLFAPNHPQQYLQHSFAPNQSLQHLQYPQHPFNPNLSQHHQHPFAPLQQNAKHPFAPNLPSQYPHHRPPIPGQQYAQRPITPNAPNLPSQYPHHRPPIPGQQYTQRPITPNLGHLPQAPQRPFTHFDYERKHQLPAIPPRAYNGWQHST